jgi:glycopeptide antibiotics resistance protein
MTPRQRVLAARGAYLVVVLVATLSNLAFSWDLAAAAERLRRAFELSLGWRDAIDGLRNVTLFAGLGGVWVVSAPAGNIRAEVIRATIVGLAISITVEGLQCFSPVRTASIVDLATNAFGAFAGAGAVAVLIGEVRRAKGARSYLGVPAFLLAGAYGVATLCEALTPLFHSEPLSVDGGPLARWHVMVRAALPLSFSEVRWLDVALFAPAGFLAVMFVAERVREGRRAWPAVALVGAVLTVAAHAAHGMFGLPIRWEAAATDAVGLASGAWAGDRWLAGLTQALRGPSRARAALTAYAGLLVLWGWRPLLPETRGSAILEQFTADHLVPLRALAGRVDVFSAVHIAQQFFLYFPLGAILAVWPLQSTGRWSNLWPAVYLAFAIEAGHVLIAGRFLDDTNALVACAGLAIGWIVVRRSGFIPYGTVLPDSA